MSEKIYLHLLLFCGIFCQGIFATLSGEDSSLLSDVHVRKRRVINHLPEGRRPTVIEEVNYIVKIQDSRHGVCAGAILSNYNVITAAFCMRLHVSDYKVLSGGTWNNRCNNHSVSLVEEYYGNPPYQNRENEGIALITVDPPFVYTRKTGNIQLHPPGHYLPAGTMVTVFGWGCSYPIQPGPVSRLVLHFITLPTISLGECQTDYRNYFSPSEKHICTYHAQQYCARGDNGAPLILNDMLAGIHIYKGLRQHSRNPDVYINLQRADYYEWVRHHSLLM